RSDAINIDAKERLEDKRRYDLACPPVVTYGTYRGLRELHSPISEGEEAIQPDGHEDKAISSCAVNTMSSDSQENPTAVNQASPSRTQQVDIASARSVLSDRVPVVESELTPAHQLPDVPGSGPLFTCVETDSAFQSTQAEQSLPNDPVKSGQEHLKSATRKTLSGDSGDLTVSDINIDHHDTVPAQEQSSKQQKPSLIADRTDGLDPDSQTCWTLEDFQLKRAWVDSGMDEEVLRMESKKMVDSILTNAVAALHKMDASEMESGVLLTCKPNEGSEALLFERLDGRGDGGTNTEHQFRVMLTDHTLSVVLEETLGGHVDCSRSPPSSGYESIAGSDTDIRCIVGVASDVTATSGPIGSQNENQAILEYLLEEKEDAATASHKSSGRNSLLSAAAADELLSPNVHSNKEESLWDEQHMGDVSICEAEWVRGEKRPQDTAKDNATSNNCRLSLNGTCGTAPSGCQESPQQSQTLSVMENFSPDMTDLDVMSGITQQSPATQSHKSEHYEQIHVSCHPWVKSNILEGSILLSGPRSELSAANPVALDEHFKTELGVNRADAGTIHLDPVDSSSKTAAVVPQHSRFHDLDLHQVDGGFAIISEEEESDMVFVNDTGPMHSPSTRRAKAYPFSLSPIYEEEAGDTAGSSSDRRGAEERGAAGVVHPLPPASSVICSSVEDGLPRSYSHGDDSEDDDENPGILQSHQLTEAEPERETASDTPDRIQEGRDCDGTLGNVGKNADTPFYQYLKSTIMPSGDEESEDTENVV
ncbi:hypothetical protein M9458_022720, partial [Cirrhinus mrigala]